MPQRYKYIWYKCIPTNFQTINLFKIKVKFRTQHLKNQLPLQKWRNQVRNQQQKKHNDYTVQQFRCGLHFPRAYGRSEIFEFQSTRELVTTLWLLWVGLCFALLLINLSSKKLVRRQTLAPKTFSSGHVWLDVTTHLPFTVQIKHKSSWISTWIGCIQ